MSQRCKECLLFVTGACSYEGCPLRDLNPQPETTSDLAVLATWERWHCRSGIVRRHNPNPTGQHGFQESIDGRGESDRWQHSLNPGPRPWTRVRVERKPAPATLGECMERATVGRIMRRTSWPEHTVIDAFKMLADLSAADLTSNDWVYRNHCISQWVSPNGWVEGDE